MKRINYLILLGMFCLLGSTAFAQDKEKNKEFCSSDDGSSMVRVSASDLREMTVPATSLLKVAAKNGRIEVTGENRSDVLIRACVKAWRGSKSEAEAAVKAVRISTADGIKAESGDERDWSVSYEIRTPKNTDLDLASSNGRVSVTSINGQINVATSNARVELQDVTGSIVSKTSNGRVNIGLSGNASAVKAIDVKTNNGSISLNVPSGFGADVYAQTSNGRVTSDFPGLTSTDNKHRRSPKVNGTINGGGATVRLVTSNGKIRINSKGEL